MTLTERAIADIVMKLSTDSEYREWLALEHIRGQSDRDLLDIIEGGPYDYDHLPDEDGNRA